MKRAIAALMIFTTAVAVPLVAQASRSQSISLTFTMHFTSATTATGNWTSSSDLAVLSGKSGTVVQTTRITGKGKGKGAKTGQVIHGLKHVTASDGTFVLQFSWRHQADRAPPPQRSTEEGRRYRDAVHAKLDSATDSITASTPEAHATAGSSRGSAAAPRHGNDGSDVEHIRSV